MGHIRLHSTHGHSGSFLIDTPRQSSSDWCGWFTLVKNDLHRWLDSPRLFEWRWLSRTHWNFVCSLLARFHNFLWICCVLAFLGASWSLDRSFPSRTLPVLLIVVLFLAYFLVHFLIYALFTCTFAQKAFCLYICMGMMTFLRILKCFNKWVWVESGLHRIRKRGKNLVSVLPDFALQSFNPD